MTTAVCPGSFDPITVGHLDVIERAAGLFDQVIVCVMVNSEKRPMFTPAQRLELAQAAVAHLPNVRAQVWEGLLADLAEKEGAKVLVKGVRGSVDFDWETQLAQINRSLSPGLDTVFVPARPEYSHISSTMVREMIRYHRPLAACMPAGTAEILRRFGEGKESYGK